MGVPSEGVAANKLAESHLPQMGKYALNQGAGSILFVGKEQLILMVTK